MCTADLALQGVTHPGHIDASVHCSVVQDLPTLHGESCTREGGCMLNEVFGTRQGIEALGLHDRLHQLQVHRRAGMNIRASPCQSVM